MQIAGDRAAFRRRYPEIRGTSVEDDFEFLGWRSNRDGGEVYSRSLVYVRCLLGMLGQKPTLSIQKVVDRNIGATILVDGCISEEVICHRPLSAARVLLSQPLCMLVDIGVFLYVA